MSWRDSLQPARFRGVNFFVDSSDYSTGRRTVTHEYPFRDQPYSEDMGRKARTFSIEGYVLGDDYFTARNELLDALEKPGPGELIHPYHGTRSVAVASVRVRESTDRGGMATFSIEFEETPAQPAQPTVIPDAAGAVRDSASALQSAAGAEFIAKYVTDATRTESVAGMLRSATLKINNAVSTVNMAEQDLALMKRRITEFEDSIDSILDTPQDILDGLTGIFALVSSGFGDIYDFDAGERPPSTTANREIEQTNYDATQRVIQRMAVVRMALTALDEEFDSYDSAVAARSLITDLLDDQSDTAADDTYPSLLQLRADLVKAIPGDDSELARLVSYTAPVSVPSLVLTHQLYGNLDLESDLLSRNAIKNPMFVIGSRELEVLSSDS